MLVNILNADWHKITTLHWINCYLYKTDNNVVNLWKIDSEDRHAPPTKKKKQEEEEEEEEDLNDANYDEVGKPYSLPSHSGCFELIVIAVMIN